MVVSADSPSARYVASHRFAFTSMWFVGSSSNNKAGSLSKARASATRICQPPESSEHGRWKSSLLKLKPVKTRLARCSIWYPPRPSNSSAVESYAFCAFTSSSGLPAAAASAASASASAWPAAVAGIWETASS
mmetsp:Transcript_1427/g.4456  ORF Transcript_1427/g.4456 Transcript_1427/m.4456 type:complete len:133 (+) Transcript_1427:593-991(+)